MKNPGTPALALCAAIAGCGSLDIARYSAPPGRPPARLHIDYLAQPGAYPVHVNVVNPASESKCNLFLGEMAQLAVLGGVPTAGYAPAMSRDVAIGAGEPITLAARVIDPALGGGYIGVCTVRMKFTPEAGGDYRMTFRNEVNRCVVTLAQRTTEAGVPRSANVATVNPAAGCK